MQGFNVDKVKTLNAALYILNNLGETDYHKIFKILYFADQQHLKLYGRPLTGDSYVAMPFGPVPSFLYDVFKAAEKGASPFEEALVMAKSFNIKRTNNKPSVSGTVHTDMDELSATNIIVLDHSINENRTLNFDQLVKKSHDTAWEKAEKQPDTEISYLEMAKAAGSTEDMLKYIRLNAENDDIDLK